MALSPEQQTNANIIAAEAKKFGIDILTAQGAKEIAELQRAAYAESGLIASNYYGKSSGQPFRGEGQQAAGLFQLLSSGYITRAEAIGKTRGDKPGTAVFDPVANTDAILPAYIAYFKAHPGFAAGEAAAVVEASGKSASWYAGAGGGAVTVTGDSAAQAVDKAKQAATTVWDGLTSIPKALGFLISYRGLEVIGGSLLLLLGLFLLARTLGVPTPAVPGVK